MSFRECDACAAKPGSPILCAGCLANRAEITRLQHLRVQLETELRVVRCALQDARQRPSYAAGVRRCITQLHERADSMNDPHARGILNGAALALGEWLAAAYT